MVVVVDEGKHLGHEVGELVNTQLRHVQDGVGPLQVGRGECSNEAALDCVVLVCCRGVRDEVHHMCCRVLVQGGHDVVELCRVLGDVAHGKLGLCLAEPDVGPCLPELGKLEHDGVSLISHDGGGGLTLSRPPGLLGLAAGFVGSRLVGRPEMRDDDTAAAAAAGLLVTSRKSSQSVGVTNEARSQSRSK